MKNSIFIKILLSIFSIFILLMWFIFFNIYKSETSKAYDSTILVELSKIKESLQWKDNYAFEDISSYNKYFWTNIKLNNNCIYLKSVDTWDGFVFAFKIKYNDNIKKYWEYYLYKSIPEYKISDEEMAKIQETINKECLK